LTSKKDKFLESAQKFIMKGQLDRAIKDYEQVVALEPNDIRHRQRLAELLVRANRTIEAIGEYEAIGKYYTDNGFYLKAIAVYKQIQKLDPDNIKTNISLASLNEKQGLTGNALAEYGKVCSYFEKNGKLNDALSILESMITIDPENLATRLKVAETRYSLGQKSEAYADFSQIAILLRRRGDESAFGQMADRVRYLYPGKEDFALELLGAEIESGNAPFAIRHLQELTEKDKDNLRAWNLLLDAYRATAAVAETRDALQKMLSIFADESSVRERLLQCALDSRDLEGGLALLDQFGDFFASRGELHLLERIYKGFLDLAPHDFRLLKGLEKVYEAGGDQAKLNETVALLESLDRSRTRVEGESNEFPSPDAIGEPVVPDEVPDAEAHDEGAIPLNLAEEGEGEPAGSDMDLVLELQTAKAALDSSEIDSSADSGYEHEFNMEVDLELEFSEDDMAGLPPVYGEDTEDADAAPGGDDIPEGSAAFADTSADFSESPAPVEDQGFATEFVEMTVDSLFEQEAAEEEEAVRGTAADTNSPDRLFSGFKKGLDQQLEQGDTETRYNLGFAFMEMGLYDEAITEFEAAASDPQRRIDCLTLQGICCRDKGDFARAEEIFRNGIAQVGLSDEEYLSITYELALLYESAGRTEDALAAYRLIQERQHDFRETKSKIAHLQGGEEPDDLELVELVDHDDLV
jgi:tetratricopeptide (TPR) repeat protein